MILVGLGVLEVPGPRWCCVLRFNCHTCPSRLPLFDSVRGRHSEALSKLGGFLGGGAALALVADADHFLPDC